MTFFRNLFADAIHLFYPHVCTGCGSDLVSIHNLLCLKCIGALPRTNFAIHAANPIEKIFWGRLPLAAAHSEFYFSKETLIQHLIHQLKYKNNQQIGFYLGQCMGKSILESNRFKKLDGIIPLPLYSDKERKRGYNQATVIANGVSDIVNVPVINDIIIRQKHTDTQTRKHRAERWDNVSESFAIKNSMSLVGKNLLLVDDVITTGATLEACGAVILSIENVILSIATLAHAPK